MQTELRTERLVLRPYSEKDILRLVVLLGAKEVSATTLRIPFPYTEKDAREFVQTQESPASKYGMFEIASGELVGGIGLSMYEQHRRAELGYWVGVPYWGKGYATEAAREMVRHGFEDLKLNRIVAGVFGGNAASVRVLEKAGFKHEGTLREHFMKFDKFLDDDLFAMLASEWKAQHL